MIFDWLYGSQVNLSKLPTYVITPNSNEDKWHNRRVAVEQMLRRRRFKDWQFVHGITCADPVHACSMGHAIALKKALERKVFKPFIVFEDDVADERSMPVTIEVPPNADAVYLGASTAGVEMAPTQDNQYTHKLDGNFFSLTDYDNIVRIYNMLSTHAVLINSERFARNWLMCSVEAQTRQSPIDVMLGLTHATYNVYALRFPLFYQANHLGGQEHLTRRVIGGRLLPNRAAFRDLTFKTRPACVAREIFEP